MTVVARRIGLGGTFLEDLAQGFSDSLKTDATDWLVREYAKLRAAPAEIARLRTLAARLQPIAIERSGAADLRGQIDSVPSRLADLSAQYPAMMAAVDAAYKIVSDASAGVAPAQGSALFTAATGAVAAIVQAKGFMAGLGDANRTLMSAVDQLIAGGQITQAEAQALMVPPAGTAAVNWGKVLMWGAGIGAVAYFLSRKRR